MANKNAGLSARGWATCKGWFASLRFLGARAGRGASFAPGSLDWISPAMGQEEPQACRWTRLMLSGSRSSGISKMPGVLGARAAELGMGSILICANSVHGSNMATALGAYASRGKQWGLAGPEAIAEPGTPLGDAYKRGEHLDEPMHIATMLDDGAPVLCLWPGAYECAPAEDSMASWNRLESQVDMLAQACLLAQKPFALLIEAGSCSEVYSPALDRLFDAHAMAPEGSRMAMANGYWGH